MLFQDRLKQAFKQQELGGTDGHRRKRKTISSDVKESETDEKAEANKIKEEERDEKPKPKKKSLPPPMGYAELIKLAEKKQYEPVIIEVKPKDEELRPMTKRQQQEYIREKERKEQREKNSIKDQEVKKTGIVSLPSKTTKTQPNKIVKTSEKSVTPNPIPDKSILKTALTTYKKINNKPNDKHNLEKTDSSKCISKDELLEERKKLEIERRELERMRRIIEEEKKKLTQCRNKQEDVKCQIKSNKISSKPKVVNKQLTCKDVKPRQLPPADLKVQSTVNDKPKQFPPPDVRPIKRKQIVKKSAPNKRKFTYNIKYVNHIKCVIYKCVKEGFQSRSFKKLISFAKIKKYNISKICC